MSVKTLNYELVKPELNDPADITLTNENWDKIDNELKEVQTAIENIGDNVDFVYSEESKAVEGEPPEIDPVVKNELQELTLRVDGLEDSFSTAANEIGNAIVALGVNVPDGTDLHNMARIIEGQLYKRNISESLSGIVEIRFSRQITSNTGLVEFIPPFQGIPTVSVARTSGSGSVSVVENSVSESGCTVELKAPSGGWTNAAWFTAEVEWTAVYNRT